MKQNKLGEFFIFWCGEISHYFILCSRITEIILCTYYICMCAFKKYFPHGGGMELRKVFQVKACE